MAFYKSTLIDNYFKPFAKSSQTKRPPPEDTPGQPPAKRKSPLGSPGQSQGVNQNECAETLDTIENFSLHSASRHQSSPAISKPAEPKPTIPTPLQDDTAAPTASINTTPIHPSSDTGSQKIAVPGSQSLLTSSQRIVRNGEVRIRDSDEDSNSDTSLEDLNELLAMHEPARGASPPSEPELPHPRPADDADSSTTKRKKRGRNSARQTDSPLPSALPVIPKIYKISLESLAKQRKQYDASKDCVAQAKSILDRYDQQKASTGEKSRPSERTGGLEADLINVVMKNHGDEDDIGRLKTAIHRTEALQHGKSWSFFEDYPEELSSEQDDFPILSSDHRLKPILSGRSSRQQAFLSGYIGEYAKRESLPEEIMLWLMDAVCHEPRDDLRHSYTATLNAADELYSLLTPERIDTLFQKLGATAMAVDVEKKLVPRAIISQSTEVVLRPNLLSILELLQRVASDLRPESRKHVLYTLCRLSLDNSVATNYHAIRAIENAFASLANSISEECLEDEILEVLNTVYRTITDTTLRLQLLQSIPALAPRLISIRQRLALAFFFQDVRLLSKRLEDSINLGIIAQHLQDPQFTISNVTDYAEVAATIGILSIGIDCGDPPSAPLIKQEEVTFNRDVDSLALKIKAMFTRINDTGASHMKRTEAKETLEAFHSRLLFAVRTKAPPKKTIFGDSQVRSIKEMFQPIAGGKQDHVTVLTSGV